MRAASTGCGGCTSGSTERRRAATRPASGGAAMTSTTADFGSHVKPLIADIPGWLTDEEGEALYELARRCCGDGVIVEIGSWKGKSTVCLGLGSRAGNSVPVYAIDPHADYRFGDFKTNVERAGIADLVRPIASFSQPAADEFDEPIEFLFVDGSTTVARKVAHNSLADRARNRYVLGVKTAFWLGSSALKKQRRLLPKPVERLGRRMLKAIQ